MSDTRSNRLGVGRENHEEKWGRYTGPSLTHVSLGNRTGISDRTSSTAFSHSKRHHKLEALEQIYNQAKNQRVLGKETM